MKQQQMERRFEAASDGPAEPPRWAQWVLITCLLLLVVGFAVTSRWPLVGDSVLMHYVVWLTRHGFAPYRDIAEMNMPFAYLSEGAAMRVFGTGNGGWRLYDGALVVAMVVLCWRLLRGRGPAAGVFAGTLFAAAHWQDGVHMAGQRDLLVAVLQVGAGLLLVWSFGVGRGRVFAGVFGASGLGVAAACIKPPAVLFVVAVVAWRAWVVRQEHASRLDHGPGVPGQVAEDASRASDGAVEPTLAAKSAAKVGRDASKQTFALQQATEVLGAALLGAAVPVAVCWVYLLRFGAVDAFVAALRGLVPYHASLERRSIGFLLGHAWSPLAAFVAVSLIVMVLGSRLSRWTRVEVLSAIGVGVGLISYVVQGKGFPYQRYPMLVWLLLLCVSRVWAVLLVRDATASARQFARWAGYVAVACGLVLLGLFVVRASRYSDVDPYTALRNDLRTQEAAEMDGAVQCLDTAGPCIGALLKERLTQSTGFLYDCYLLDGSKAVVQEQRAMFEREWTARMPELVVLTDSNCFTGPRTFAKYTSWPWMQAELSRYEVVVERRPATPLRLWSRAEQPYAYRILRRAR